VVTSALSKLPRSSELFSLEKLGQTGVPFGEFARFPVSRDLLVLVEHAGLVAGDSDAVVEGLFAILV